MPDYTLNTSQVVDSALKKIADTLMAKFNFNAQYGYRPLRPSDISKMSSVTGTAAYSYTLAAGTSTILTFTIPADYAIAIFGLEGYNVGSLAGGYSQIIVNGVVRQEIPLADLASAQSGQVYAFDQTVLATSTEVVSWVINNPQTTSVSAAIWLLGYIAGKKSALNIRE